MKLTIESYRGESEKFEVTEQEYEGVIKYMKRHPRIDGVTLTRIYLRRLRSGTDLNATPLPKPSPEQTNGKTD